MICADARNAMLTADLEELRAERGELANHLRSCGDCARIASRLIVDTRRVSAAVIVRARRRAHLRTLAVLASLPLAAALVASVALVRHRSRRAPVLVEAVAPRSARPVARRISVDVAKGQHAAVINTVDPSVTVIWLTPGDAP